MEKLQFPFGKEEDWEPIEEELTKIGGDPHFIHLVMDWYGFQRKGRPIGKISESYKRRIKRELQADNLYDEREWKDLYLKNWKDLKNTKLLRGLYKGTPVLPNPRNRPEEIAKYKIVHVLRIYFEKLTGDPQMELIALILSMDYDSLNREWRRKKARELPSDIATISANQDGNTTINYKPFSPEDEYKLLQEFYLANKEQIIEAEQRHAPLYKGGT